jgi:hypothetical protein
MFLPLKYGCDFWTYQGTAPTFTFIWIMILDAADIAPLGFVRVLLFMN